MGFNLSGLVAGGANEGLEQVLERRLKEAIRQQQAQQQAEQIAMQREQMGMQREQMAGVNADREANREHQRQLIDIAKLERVDKQNRAATDRNVGLDAANVLNMPGMSREAQASELQQSVLRNPDAASAPGMLKIIEGLTKVAPRTPLHSVTVPGPDGRPMAKGVTDEELQAGVATYREPKSAGAEEPLVAIMGPDGVPVLVRRSQAEGKRPASTREQGRPVMVSSAKDMADIDEAMKLAQQLDFDQKDTGIMPSIGGAMPDAVTNLTGFGMEAKKRQGVINLVKQIVGKGLEGGVLRKEDESKYEKILPTLSDPAEVVKAKKANLIATLGQKRSTLLDALTDAGFDTSKFIGRGEPGKESGAASEDGASIFSVKAPNGKTYTFKSAAELATFKAKAGLQ
jgi:hypothetical protein